MKRTVFILAAACLAAVALFAGCTLPPPANMFEVTFAADCAAGGTIEGKTTQFIAAGGHTDAVRAVPALGYSFAGWSNGTKTEEITVAPDSDMVITAKFEILPLSLPIFTIDTENGAEVEDKENYVPCSVSVGNTAAEYVIEDAEAEIKGRGNSTWGYDKKPYKIKFTQKTDLFGFGKAKTWVLLAEWLDGSMMRNRLALSCGTLLGLEESSKTQPVELYFNGRYDGVYILCEQTQAGSTRVDISEDISEGDDQAFLVELDNRAPQEGTAGLEYFVMYDDIGTEKYYAVKSPETDGAGYSGEVTENISRIVLNAWNTVCNGSWEEIENKIDVDSFAKTCIVHQLFKTYDAVAFSWYLYKDAGAESKIKSGPLWDFDLSAGLGDYYPELDETHLVNPEALWPVSEMRANRWYVQLLEHSQFKDRIKELLNGFKDEIAADIDGKIREAKDCGDSYHRNYARWDNLGTSSVYIPEEIRNIPTWEGHMDNLAEYLKKSLNYLVNFYCNEQ